MSITLELSSPGVGVLTLDRVEKRNAVDGPMAGAFADAIAKLEAESATAVVLRGAGPVFCGGNDLKDLGPGDVASAPATRLVEAMTGSDLFWITLVEGPAIGAGVSIAAVSQVVLATTTARFELPESRMGLFPSVIFDQLARTLGRRDAFTACLTGASFSADEARALGLVTEVVTPGAADAALETWLARLGSDPAFVRAAARAWREHLGAAHELDREARLSGLLEEQFSAFSARRAAD